MSLEDDLLEDLSSESDSESEVIGLAADARAPQGTSKDEDGDDVLHSVDIQLNELIGRGKDVTTSELISMLDMNSIKDITKISRVQLKLRPVIQSIEQYLAQDVSKKEEYNFLITVNDLSLEISNEIGLIHNFIRRSYEKRFPELESLIPNAVEYTKIVKTLGNTLDFQENELSFLTKEKILVLTMSIIQAKSESEELTEEEITSILIACNLLLDLEESRVKIADYVASRLAFFAPNLSELVGPYTAAQLMSVLGGLKSLSSQPSCNIAAIGSKKAIGIGFGKGGIRHQGYLYYSDLIQSVPPDLRKNALRIVSGKLILAARTDFAKGSPDGELGRKWKKEVLEKLEKLAEPPENKAPKALPIPIDAPSKKRAGRRYRKLKQRFEVSELRKAQNRMEFGKQEHSVTDAFGEEIGLGMTSSLSHIPINMNNRAKVSKNMKSRLEKSSSNLELFNQDFINLAPQRPKQLKHEPTKRLQ